MIFLAMTSEVQTTKTKSTSVTTSDEKASAQQNNQQNEKGTYRMGENL